MKFLLRHMLAASSLALATHAVAQVTLFEKEGFNGRSYRADKQLNNFERIRFNDRVSSVLVQNQRWEVCEDVRFSGRCVVLRPGQYPSLAAMGMNDRVSSARPVRGNARFDDDRYAPPAPPYYDARRRNNERLYQAQVTSVRAVVGPPEQRCWVEREQVSGTPQSGSSNVPAAIAGALIGGILGHQVGNGRGQDLATVGGAIAGGAIGNTVGRDSQQAVPARDVERCAALPGQAQLQFWDVTYDFRGQSHTVQMTTEPGRTIKVNRDGEPRV